MSELGRAEARVQIARGHWSLGESEEALAALDRAIAENASHPPLREFLDAIALEVGDDPLAERLRALRAKLETGGRAPSAEAGPASDGMPSLSTSTLAELLADQGHAEQALRVAEDVLRRDPEDTRAQAVRGRLQPKRSARERQIAELERWLANLRGSRREGVSHR